VSCLVYLNDEWRDEWAATTNFFDPPTGQVVEVSPWPGRIIVMDQDVVHSVTPPSELAPSGRPRYSLVFKLILHEPPSISKKQRASCMDWPVTPLAIGSARGTKQSISEENGVASILGYLINGNGEVKERHSENR